MPKQNILTMVGHYAQNYMLKGRLSLEKRNAEGADQQRQELIEKLKSLGENDLAKKCVSYLEETKWDSHDKVNSFQKWYDENNPQSQEMDDAVSQLFGEKN